MKTVIALAKQDMSLHAFFIEMESLLKRREERLEWLQKQAERVIEELDPLRLKLWDDIELYLKEKKLLPEDYSKEKYTLSMDQDGAVSIEDKNHVDSISSMLEKFFK